MLTTDVKRLCDTFDGWTMGQPYPTLETWAEFRRSLVALRAKVALLELGVDLTVMNAAVEAEKPGSNVVVLQPRRRMVPIGDGGAR